MIYGIALLLLNLYERTKDTEGRRLCCNVVVRKGHNAGLTSGGTQERYGTEDLCGSEGVINSSPGRMRFWALATSKILNSYSCTDPGHLMGPVGRRLCGLRNGGGGRCV